MKERILKYLTKAKNCKTSSFFNFKDDEVGKISFYCYKSTRTDLIHYLLTFEKARIKCWNDGDEDFNEPENIEALLSMAEQTKAKILSDDEQLLKMGFHRVHHAFYKYRIKFPLNTKDKFATIDLEKYDEGVRTPGSCYGSWKLGKYDMGVFKTNDLFDGLEKVFNKMDHFLSDDYFMNLPEGLRDWYVSRRTST